jgi:hypothetical protein
LLTALVLAVAIIWAESAASVKSAARSAYDDAEFSKYIDLVLSRGSADRLAPHRFVVTSVEGGRNLYSGRKNFPRTFYARPGAA